MIKEIYTKINYYMGLVSGSRSNSGWQRASTGNNYINGSSNAYEMGQNRATSLIYTFTSPQEVTEYTFKVSITGQGNGYYNNPTVTLTYTDNTTEVVYTHATGFFTEEFTFTPSKPFKSIKITGTLTHSSKNYVGVYVTLYSIYKMIWYKTFIKKLPKIFGKYYTKKRK